MIAKTEDGTMAARWCWTLPRTARDLPVRINRAAHHRPQLGRESADIAHCRMEKGAATPKWTELLYHPMKQEREIEGGVQAEMKKLSRKPGFQQLLGSTDKGEEGTHRSPDKGAFSVLSGAGPPTSRPASDADEGRSGGAGWLGSVPRLAWTGASLRFSMSACASTV